MDEPNGFVILLLIPVIACAVGFSMIVIVPGVLQIPSTYSGQVSSTQATNYIIASTNIHFKDGSYLLLWGIYDIPVGNHTFQVTSSWLGINNLQTLDGAHP